MNGVNHWPHDIESTVENSHKMLRKGCVAAFSVITADISETLYIVAEIRKDAKINENVIKEIKQTVQKNVFTNNSLPIRTGFPAKINVSKNFLRKYIACCAWNNTQNDEWKNKKI